MHKKTIAILFGGQSAEHEVSVVSAQNVMDAMDKDLYNILPIGIDRSGNWYSHDDTEKLLQPVDIKSTSDSALSRPLEVRPGNEEFRVSVIPGNSKNPFFFTSSNKKLPKPDAVFPVLHGPFGEDGTIQGLLKLANLPFVGAGVTSSAVSMDKVVMKKIIEQEGISTARYKSFQKRDADKIKFNEVVEKLNLPLFIKPSALGSSVGIGKATDESSFDIAVKRAFEYDQKILIEEYIEGRELECAVLGNDSPEASGVGEIITPDGFYSYEAKYTDEKGARLVIPADLPDHVVNSIRKEAVRTYKALNCEGMARVDFFLTKDSKIYINEVNTIPGFTKISMYPQLWEEAGTSYPELINKLISLAIQRFKNENKLKLTV